MPLPATALPATQQTAAIPAFPNGSMHAGKYTLIFRIRNKESQELLKEHRLLLMPQSFTQDTEARTTVYYTKGGIVADTPIETGVGMTVFQISGHTGFRGILGVPAKPDPFLLSPLPDTFIETVQQTVQSIVSTFGGNAAPVTTSLVDGAAAIKDLQDTLFAYFFPQGQVETRVVTQTSALQLEFLNLSAPTSSQDQTGRIGHIIHPHRNLVSLRQDATRPFLYFYQLQFASIGPLTDIQHDVFVEQMTQPRISLFQSLRDFNAAVTSITNGINTIEDAFTQMVITNVTGPVNTFLTETARLGDSVGNFMNSIADKIAFPLYAQRTFLHALDAPKHSVTTLAQAARDLGTFLMEAADPRSLSALFAGVGVNAGLDDALTLALNQEQAQTLHLGTVTGGSQIAAAIQAQVRALTPQHDANASAYRDFTATYDETRGQYRLSSGTKLSPAGQTTVVVSPDPLLTPNDASVVLGLGQANGGQEIAGTDIPVNALALLRGVERACLFLQGFPDYFADQLATQDAAVAALLPVGVVRKQIQGEQRLLQTRITPGDSLHGIAGRVGVDWQTLALVNHLRYPYIFEQPTELTRGRATSADFWHLSDTQSAWVAQAYQGDRLDIVAGAGAGQSRRIIANSTTTVTLETAWAVLPNDTSTYAIRSAANPILATSTISSATSMTLTDSTLTLVPGSQRGLELLLASGPSAGERARIAGNDATTYTLEAPWQAIPPAGSLYLVLGADAAKYTHQRLVGDWIGVPHPSAQVPLPVRSRLQDVSVVTGRRTPREEQLFGRDLVLMQGALVWDATAQDAATIAGLANLRQAIIHLVNLPLGELEYLPSLGSYVQEELGLAATLPLEVQVLQSVDRTIRQDARIARMEFARLIAQGGRTVIAFGARAISGDSVARVTIR